MASLFSSNFEPPKRASTSHLIHLIGIERFRTELSKQQKAQADGILEVISATSIRRNTPATEKEHEMLHVVYQMNQSGEIDDLVLAQIKAMFIYLGAAKDKKGYILSDNFIFPDDWEPIQDLKFAKRLLPKFLNYQLQGYDELGRSIDKILENTAYKNTNKDVKLSPEELKKAEELAYWNVIKDSKNKKDLENFLKRFKGGTCERLAYVKLEEIVWSELGDSPSIKSLHKFLKNFPYGRYADKAKSRIEQHVANQKRKSLVTQINSIRPNQSKDKLSVKFQSEQKQKKINSGSKFKITNLINKKKVFLTAVYVFTFLTIGYIGYGYLGKTYKDDSYKTFTGHSKPLKSAVFTPDGNFILSASEDKTLKLWSIKTGQDIRTFWGHKDIISSVSISVDGRYALSGSHDNTLKLWDIKTAKLMRTFTGHKNWVVSVAFSPDNKYALSGSYDKTIKIWNIKTGKLVKTLSGHNDWVISVAFTKNKNFIVSGSHDKTLMLWNIKKGTPVKTFKGHNDWVTSVSASNKSPTVLSGSYDETIKLWNLKTGKEIRTLKTTNTSAITSVAFSPSFTKALSSSFDDQLILWDLTNGDRIRTFKGHASSRANAVAFSPDGHFALSAGQDKTIKLWKLMPKKLHSSLTQ